MILIQTAMNSIEFKIAALEEEIRKLKLFRDLLKDPEFAAIAKEQLLKQAEVKGAAHQPQERETPRPRRRTRRQLKKRALDIVTNSTEPLTAKDVTEKLASQKFDYDAVAVSKALRSLAREGEIRATPGEKAKSAIRYSALPSLLNVSDLSGQEMRPH